MSSGITVSHSLYRCVDACGGDVCVCHWVIVSSLPLSGQLCMSLGHCDIIQLSGQLCISLGHCDVTSNLRPTVYVIGSL